ncbi:MAG: acyl-CoA dehydrogenase family protein, partial [Acidimicrobiia bacterium]
MSPEQFALEARQWLAANMRRRDSDASSHSILGRATHRDADDLARQRSLQRKVFEGGYAGITWPIRYGGRGLGAEHERAFAREASNYVMPDRGIAGGTTALVCGPTVLVHATDDFRSRHAPAMLAGDV